MHEQKVRLLILTYVVLVWKSVQGTIGYNLAALQYIKRQHDARKTAEFYERDTKGQLTEEAVRAKLAESGKKRKRAIVK